MLLNFPSPVPLDIGCIITLKFPAEITLTAALLTKIEGYGLFGAVKTLTGTLTTATNTFTITNGCPVY
jgi:hypothetical protein